MRCEVDVPEGGAFRESLLAKVVEEAEELRAAGPREDAIKDLADVIEVLEALLHIEGIDVEQVRAVQAGRREARGGFERRYRLRWTEGEGDGAVALVARPVGVAG